MKIYKLPILIILLIRILTSCAQELGELELQTIPFGQGVMYIVRDPEASVLIVHSTIPQLNFDCNMGIIKVDNPDPGEYKVFLYPGANIVTFKAQGYLPLKKTFQINKKDYAEVKIRPLKSEGIEADKGTVEFIISPGPVYIEIDGSFLGENTVPPTGVLSLKLIPGAHQITISRMDFEKKTISFEVVINQTISQEIALKPLKGEDTTFTTTNYGPLSVRSYPDGATIYIDGVKMEKPTPCDFKQIGAGEHIVILEKLLYETYTEKVEVSNDQIFRIEASLKPEFAKLEIKSNPSNAELSINDKPVGKTTYLNPQQPSGTYKLHLNLWKYHDKDTTFSLEAGKDKSISINLSPAFGRVNLNSNPQGADLTANGEYWGQTPVVKDEVLSGKFLIKLSKELYAPLETTIEVKDGETSTQSFLLTDISGSIEISSEPSNMEIYIDEKSKGRTPQTFRLKPGLYNVRIKDPNLLFKDYEQTTALESGRKKTIDAKLIRKTGSVTIYTDPLDAKVYWEGKLLGKSPQMKKDIPTGEYNIEVRMDGYLPVIEKINIKDNQFDSKNYQLSKKGGIEITTQPSNAKIFINDKLSGASPLIQRDLDNGNLEIVIEKEDYLTVRDNIKIEAGKMVQVNFVLEKKPKSSLSWVGNVDSWEIDWFGSYKSRGGQLFRVGGKGYDITLVRFKLLKFAYKNSALGGSTYWKNIYYKGTGFTTGEFEIGAAMNQYLRKNSDQIIVPFLCLNAAYRNIYQGSVSCSQFVLSYGGGLAFFVTPTLALRPEITYEYNFPSKGEQEFYYGEFNSSKGWTFSFDIATFIFPQMANSNDPAWAKRYNNVSTLSNDSWMISLSCSYLTHKYDFHLNNSNEHNNFVDYTGFLNLGKMINNNVMIGVFSEWNGISYKDSALLDYNSSSNYSQSGLGIGPSIEYYFNSGEDARIRPFVGYAMEFYKFFRNINDYKRVTDWYQLAGGIYAFQNPSWAVRIGIEFDIVSSTYNGNTETGTVFGVFTGVAKYF